MDIRAGAVLDGPNGQAVTVETLLARGGFGQVFAGQLADGTRVAIKTVLTASLDENELRTLQNEATHATSIEHPNVVRVLHVNTGGDKQGMPPYLVMEFVEGGDLRAFIERHRLATTKPDVGELRAMFLQIAEGMRAVNVSIVHRDLKPENVLVDAQANRLKITDFGLAKLADAATRSETFKGWGTRAYQAPEAFEHGPNTVAMDMYAAGVMFFEMAAVVRPLQPKPGDNSPLAWRNAHLLAPPLDLRAARPDLPQDLLQLIMLMLQKNPARRPTSWDSVIDQLKKGAIEVPGRPDVSALVQKATATLARTTAQEAQAREQQERNTERRALLEQAFLEPVQVLRTLVDAFNDSTEVGKLVMKQSGAMSAVVASASGQRRFELRCEAIDDLNSGSDGVFRILGVAEVTPMPTASTNDAYADRESFGGFNLAYRVADSSTRFGNWALLRFEHNPLTGRSSYPRWFALDLTELRRKVQVLRAMDVYQHQERGLDDAWFKELLGHLL